MSSSRASVAAASKSPEPSVAKVQDDKTETAVADGVSPGSGKISKAESGAKDDASTASAEEKTKARDDPPVPDEPTPDGPPLPNEPAPETEDDGWDCQWEPVSQAWFFYNRHTGVSQWENPRVPEATSAGAGYAAAPAADNFAAPVNERPAAGGYNPAVHGDYDPNAWYAQAYNQEKEEQEAAAAAAAAYMDPSAAYGEAVGFNRFNGQFQAAGAGPNRHSDEAKSRRQMNAFFDVDAAANAHDGRSLKAERQNQKLTKSELKAYKEKRRAKKEEKRRAWLLD
ncbi:WW domain-containing protein [Hirsutella rhossiliensis]|uniref:WW domain-containing protein n=1 Tax=Hirsutella rhossiliensis TaxID=111463 RepID=A0A9P8N300_9HYPO|nr:WW domain-containing protein [Hirsutella rhossiliensis]KAH0965940.1 WW domain-containing protein [Hirsutella rhossiliensis]